MLVEDRIKGVENRLENVESMLQIVIDGGKELNEDMVGGFQDIRSEIDKQNDLIRDLRKRLLQRMHPKTLFVILFVCFGIWCIFLYLMHV